MNKKKTIILALALLLMMGVASLAYFTDFTSGDVDVSAGKVLLNEREPEYEKSVMVPGGTKNITLSAEYAGNIDAEARLRLFDRAESVPSEKLEGFKLTSGITDVEFANKNAVDFIVLDETFNEINNIISVPLTLKLLPGSTNKYQNASYSVKYEIQVRQTGELLEKGSAGWETVIGGELKVPGAPVTP